MYLLSELTELKLLYQEIIEGCSYSNKGYYIKHLCELEQIEIERQRLLTIDKYIQEGIPTEKEKLESLKKTEEWGDQQEQDIIAFRQTIGDNEKLLSTVIPQQQEAIRNVLQEHKNSLTTLLIEKHTKLGVTVESLSSRETSSLIAILSLFKDRKCTIPLFETRNDFEDLEDEEIDIYHEEINKVIERISELSIQKISVLPFFLNAFSYCKEHIHTFLNRPLAHTTNYQLNLFSLGLRNLNILSQSDGQPPDYFEGVKAIDILRWYDTQYSIMVSKRRKENSIP